MASKKLAYDYFKPFEVGDNADTNSLVHDLTNSRAFQRLESIHFLGAIDYTLIPRPDARARIARYTRAQHSLGVARLALCYAFHRELSEEEMRLLFIASLLHDIGHAPFSHSLEPLFREAFSIDHHIATQKIISGDSPLGREIYQALKRHKIDIPRLLALIAGKDDSFDDFFGGPINFDTIEGIMRSRLYGGTNQNILDPQTVVISATRRVSDTDRETVDDFWEQKNEVYRCVINSRTGVLADYACRLFMQRNLSRFSLNDFFSTEHALFKKMLGLRKLLTSPRLEIEIFQQVEAAIAYTARLFFVDLKHGFFDWDDRRYKQKRVMRMIAVPAFNEEELSQKSRSLFDDAL